MDRGSRRGPRRDGVTMDQGRTNFSARGGYPQKSEAAAGEVVLTRAESDFLELAVSSLAAYDEGDPFAPSKPSLERDLDCKRRDAFLTLGQSTFISLWIEHKGDLLAIADSAKIEPSQFTRFLSSPSVVRILTRASQLCPNVPPPVASKEEIAAVWTLISRTDTMPLTYQREARQELSKMLGYYPSGSDAVNIGVQVVLKGDLVDG